jgi:hypothetical protein
MVALTSRFAPAINVDVTESRFMTLGLHARIAALTKNSNRQDAREGGESPPLPRNCERSMPG